MEKEGLRLHSLSSEANIGVAVEQIDYVNPYDHTVPHRHTYFEFILFEKGVGGSQIIDFSEYPNEQKTLYIIVPNQIHLMKRLPEENGILIQFTKDFLTQSINPIEVEWLFKLRSCPMIPLSEAEYNVIFDLIRKVEIEIEGNRSHGKHLLSNIFGQLFFEILEVVPKGRVEESIIENCAYKFLIAVENNFKVLKTVKSYAEMINVPVNKLTSEVKLKFGKSPLQIIHDHLMVEIKRLLMVEGLTHKEVAFRLSFDSQSSYSRFIKRISGLTPNELKYQTLTILKV